MIQVWPRIESMGSTSSDIIPMLDPLVTGAVEALLRHSPTCLWAENREIVASWRAGQTIPNAKASCCGAGASVNVIQEN